ncbi:Helicase associated domain protein [Streptomyces sp. 900105755]
MEALAGLDPGWCPVWDISWQRCLRLTLAHVKAGGALGAGPGELIVQGGDLGVWVAGQRAGWERLTPAQQWLLESVGAPPAAEGGVPTAGAPRSQDARWAANLAAARQFHAREGHLIVPRQHVEITGDGDGDSGRAAVKLGAWLDNTRRRAAKLSPQRRAELDALGMRIVPDIVCLSKSTSGYGTPMALTVDAPRARQVETRRAQRHLPRLQPRVHHRRPRAGAVLVRRLAGGRTTKLGERAGRALAETARRYGLPAPRLRGLAWGLPFDRPGAAREVCDAAYRAGLLLETAGPRDEVVKLLPPLTVADGQLAQGLGILGEAVASVVGHRALAA